MTATNRFDYPLPSLSVSINEININTNDKHEGSFEIKNQGGGTLNGKILSRCPGLIFLPSEWEGNKQTIHYKFNATTGLAAEGRLNAHVFISSNGGEIQVPVSVRLTKMSISTAEGHIVANLQDFYEYALIHPAQARRLFVDSEFYMLLLAVGYEYIEVYETLHKDSNRERAMDNFFIISGLKGKTSISVSDSSLEFVQKPYDTDILHGSVHVQKSDIGYVDGLITMQNNSPWINCHTSRLTQSDFQDSLFAIANFSIDPLKISGSYARELVTVGVEPSDKNTIEIVYRRMAPIVLQLNRTSFSYEDNGVIEVINNTGKDMRIEVFCPEKYVRFSARSYLVGEYGKIPFEIKLSAFLSAQRFFRKFPYMKTAVEIKATAPGQAYKKRIPLVVGEW